MGGQLLRCHLAVVSGAYMLCRLATFYSRSRKERWCKGETSGHFIKVTGVYVDCDRDSVVYLGEPIGPACHTVSQQLLSDAGRLVLLPLPATIRP